MFKSGIVLQDESKKGGYRLLMSPWTESHSELETIFKLRDTKQNLAKVEFSPKDLAEAHLVETYALKIDEERTPEWFTDEMKEAVTAEMTGYVNRMIVTGDVCLLIGGQFIIAQGATVESAHSMVINLISGGRVNTIWGGTVNAISGGTVNTIWGGTVNAISGGRVNTISGGTVNDIWGGRVNDISGGTVNTIWGGRVNAIRGGTVNAISGGTVNDIWGGTVNAISGGRVNTIWGGTVNDISGGTVNAISGGTVNAISGGFDGIIKTIHAAATIVRDGRKPK